MQIKVIERGCVRIAVLQDATLCVRNVQATLDLIMTVRYDTGCDRVVLPKTALHEDFFVLRTRLAGEILQKLVTYQIKCAIWGDFTMYSSKPLHDFILESNKGSHVFFASTESDAIDRLARS